LEQKIDTDNWGYSYGLLLRAFSFQYENNKVNISTPEAWEVDMYLLRPYFTQPTSDILKARKIMRGFLTELAMNRGSDLAESK
jgi:hypothetical protein